LAGTSLQDTSLHVSLPHLLEAGVGLQVFAAYVPPSLPRQERFEFARRTIDCCKEEIERYPSRIVVCRSSLEVDTAARQGKIAALLAVESGDAIEEDLNKLQKLHGLGVRIMTLIHTRSNSWVISSQDKKPGFEGLSRFGEEVVEAMNELGMIIDVSHAHDRAVEKVLAVSKAPIIASHSCMHALCPIPRNIKDELARGIASGGGLVGVNFQPAFLDCTFRKMAEQRGKRLFKAFERSSRRAGADGAELARAWLRFAADFRTMMACERIALEKLLQHIDHLITVAGEDHAAFGSDFDGIPDTPADVDDCRGFGNIVAALAGRGYRPERLGKICWSNFFRVLKTVCG
jgi:membrane dipeptidase